MFRPGSRKEKVHSRFEKKGGDDAIDYGVELGLKEGTLRSWIKSWSKNGDKSRVDRPGGKGDPARGANKGHRSPVLPDPAPATRPRSEAAGRPSANGRNSKASGARTFGKLSGPKARWCDETWTITKEGEEVSELRNDADGRSRFIPNTWFRRLPTRRSDNDGKR